MLIYLKATSRQLRRLDLASKGPLYTLFGDTVNLNGLVTIRAAGKEPEFIEANSALLGRSQKPFYLTNVARLWLASTVGLMTALINVLFVLIAVALRNTTSAGLFAVGLTQAVALQDIISLVLTSWTQLEIAAVAVERNLEYSKVAPEDDSAPHQDGEDKADDGWPSTGTVTFSNVVARYTPDGDPALKSVSFSVESGRKMGICGRTGSGKRQVYSAIICSPCGD